MGGRSPVTRCAASPTLAFAGAVRRSCTRSPTRSTISPSRRTIGVSSPEARAHPGRDRGVPPLHDTDHPSRPDHDRAGRGRGRGPPASWCRSAMPARIGTRPRSSTPTSCVSIASRTGTSRSGTARTRVSVLRWRDWCCRSGWSAWSTDVRRSSWPPTRSRTSTRSGSPPCSRDTTRWSCSAGGEAERSAECHRSLAVKIPILLS